MSARVETISVLQLRGTQLSQKTFLLIYFTHTNAPKSPSGWANFEYDAMETVPYLGMRFVAGTSFLGSSSGFTRAISLSYFTG